MLGAIVAVIPSVFFRVATAVDIEKQQTAILQISRAISIILLLWSVFAVNEFIPIASAVLAAT